MKKIFTNTFLLTLLGTVMAVFTVQAQTPNTLTITEPASVAGDYTVSAAGFGAMVTDGWGGELILLEDGDDSDFDTAQDPGGSFHDGCNGTISNVGGFIAFLDRGDCDFGTKALAAETAGAMGVIICNWVAGAGPVINMPPGTDGVNVTVPVVSMGTEDCAAIRVAITTSATGMGSYSYVVPACPPVDYGPEVIWGANGEGAFDGGLGEWVAVGVTSATDTWTWDEDANAEGQFGGADKSMLSRTACNGAALFDFQAFTFVDDPTPSTGINQAGTLTSPTMDLTNADYPVLRWTQFYNRLNNPFSTLAYSIDDGATWSAEIDVPTENIVNDFANHNHAEDIALPLDMVANEAAVKIRFSANGDFYFWMIDDVHISSEFIRDVHAGGISGGQPFYAVAPSFRTPVSQVDDVPFLIDVQNLGNQDVENVNVHVEVTNSSGAIVHEDDLNYGTVPAGFLDENKAFPDLFDVPAEIETYNVTYTLTGDDETVVDNNSVGYSFEVTDLEFAKNPLEAATSNYWFGATNPYYSVGSHYYFPNGAGYQLEDFHWGLSTQDAANFTGFINFRVYKWIDGNEDQMVQSDERQLVATFDQPVVGPTDYSDMTIIPTATNGDEKLRFEDDSHYLFMANYAPIDAMQTGFLVVSTDESEYDYGGTAVAMDTLFDGKSGRYGTLASTGADGSDDDINTRTFGQTGFTAYNPLNISMIESSVNDVNNNIQVSVFPNPTVDKVTVALDLEEASEVLTIDVLDIDGKLIEMIRYNNVQRDNFELNFGGLPTGVYMINIGTDEGHTTKQIIKE